MKKIWIRLGGYVSADASTIDAIIDGDKSALIKAIKENGFELNGESYIPVITDVYGDEVGVDEEVYFVFNPTKLTVK